MSKQTAESLCIHAMLGTSGSICVSESMKTENLNIIFFQ